MRVLVATFNAGQAACSDDLEPWLAPIQAQAPDIVAVGVQEGADLPYALAGLTSRARTRLESAILRTLSKQDDYECKSRSYTGGIFLFLYIRSSIANAQHVSVEQAHTGCGPLFMSNKGASAIRLFLNKEPFTFVTAHLAAHAHNVIRRNQDYQDIVSRVRFTNDSSIYETSHLFVFGDLNYRIKKEALAMVQDQTMWTFSSTESRPAKVMRYDQLTIEMEGGRTMQHLREADLTFKPTYKFEVGTKATYSKQVEKRAWCDRVLYASTADVSVEGYWSAMAFTSSDHKPVAKLFNMSVQDKHQNFSFEAPYRCDDGRNTKHLIGAIANLVVGIPWSTIHLLGLGNDLVGLAVLIVLLLVSRWLV